MLTSGNEIEFGASPARNDDGLPQDARKELTLLPRICVGLDEIVDQARQECQQAECCLTYTRDFTNRVVEDHWDETDPGSTIGTVTIGITCLKEGEPACGPVIQDVAEKAIALAEQHISVPAQQ